MNWKAQIKLYYSLFLSAHLISSSSLNKSHDEKNKNNSHTYLYIIMHLVTKDKSRDIHGIEMVSLVVQTVKNLPANARLEFSPSINPGEGKGCHRYFA